MRSHLLLTLALPLIIGACVAPEAAVVTGSASSATSAGAPSPTARPPTVAASASVSTTHRATSGYGLTLTADLDRTAVSPGGAIAVDIGVHNGRSTTLTYGMTSCDPAINLTATLALPLDPVGRTWSGAAGRVKDFMLTSGYGPGGVPATAPVVTRPSSPSCSIAGPPPTIGPGQTLSTTLVWHAEFAQGIPALPQPTRLKLGFLFDPDAGPPPPSPSPGGVIGSRMVTFKHLDLEVPVSIEGTAPHLLTAGQAIDAFLADPAIGAWVAKHASEPQWTANLFLESSPEAYKYQPAGPAWDVELFVEHQVPSNVSVMLGRNFVRAYIDPFDGRVIFRDFCNAPCDR